MSRRTKWRSVTEIIIRLLKNFLKLLKKEGLGSVAKWLYKPSSPGSSSKRPLSAWELWLFSSSAQAHPCQAGPQSQISDNCRPQAPWQWNAAEIWSQRARRLDRSHCEILCCLANTTASLRTPCPRPPALPLPLRVHEQQHRGREARNGRIDEVQKAELTSLGF